VRLAVSNIAWPGDAENEVLGCLWTRGIKGIEVAPTRWWPDWKGMSIEGAPSFGRRYSELGFATPSMQAILFARPMDKLFGNDAERESLTDHLRVCADLAAAIGAKSLVFGAPKNRELNGTPTDKAFDMARELFSEIAPHYEKLDVCLCLEANPTQYGCQFMINSAEAAKLVRAVDSPGIRLHLDTACMYLAGEDLGDAIQRSADVLRHFHVSEPFLGSFEAPVVDHSRAAACLRAQGYGGWISLEMRQAPEPVPGLLTAVDFLVSTYGGES